MGYTRHEIGDKDSQVRIATYGTCKIPMSEEERKTGKYRHISIYFGEPVGSAELGSYCKIIEFLI